MTIAVITARGGSKGLPRKNVLDLHGKPLLAWTIEAALRAKEVSQTVVTTDDPDIAAAALAAGAELIDRPAHLATDDARSQDALMHALIEVDAGAHHEDYVLLQPTSPLRNAKHIDAMVQMARTKGAGSMLSVTLSPFHPWKMLVAQPDGSLQPSVRAGLLSAPRQGLPQAYRQNGAMYWGKIAPFLETGHLFVEPALGYEMNAQDSVDIDDYDDLVECRALLKAG